MNKLLSPKRIRLGNVVIEYLCNKGNKSLILLNGLPSVPKNKEALNLFYNQGYTVFFPRDEGTWESEGEFLAQSPAETINNLIEEIINGIQLRDKEYKSDNISIVGSSYGGAVALCITDRDEIKKNITLSPVYTFEELTNLNTMSPFLRDVFPGAYRYKERNWQKLIKGRILAPRSHLKTVDTNKYYIFGGQLDKEILSHTLQKFGTDYNIPVKIYSELDHLGLSKIKNQLQTDVISALNS